MPDMNEMLPLEVIKIADGAYRIEDNGVRCLLFVGSTHALLVDTGFGQAGSLKAVVESITDKPVILVTSHADGDHIGNNAEFGLAHMHPAEMAHYCRTMPHIQNTNAGAQIAPLWEGSVIDIGGRALEVILIPGHTPGSIALLDRKNRFIVTGDSIASAVFMFGDFRDFHSYVFSMEKLAAMKDAFDEIYPAHGPFPLPADMVDKALIAAKKYLTGELTPMDPPMEIPAKLYEYDGAGFFAV
ncbi:MAG: MBL fold metallo-hydrolase [Oscillospiraceae bacterium]|nr:MBL fold metallo-hydrolase [Oscillospiraceae bacterium]